MQPSGETLTNYVAILKSEVFQPRYRVGYLAVEIFSNVTAEKYEVGY